MVRQERITLKMYKVEQRCSSHNSQEAKEKRDQDPTVSLKGSSPMT